MKPINIKTEQAILNKVNNKADFTYKGQNNLARYIVGIKNLHTSKNPSLYFDNGLAVINEAIDNIGANKPFFENSGKGFKISCDCLGGWYDEAENKYYLDLNSSFVNLNDAMTVAKAFDQKAIYDTEEDKVIFVK
jgi:hypothetical protein